MIVTIKFPGTTFVPDAIGDIGH